MASFRIPPSTTLPLLLLALLCFECAFATSTIYLSPTGTPDWDGNCDAQCSSAQPCGLPNTTISTTPANFTCYLHFSGGRYTTPISLKQSDNSTTLNVTFGATDGGVQDIALSLNARKVALSGSVTNGTLTLPMEVTEKVDIDRLSSVDSSFHFVGKSAPFFGYNIAVSYSNFTYLPTEAVVAQELVSIFNFDLPAGATNRSFFHMWNGNVQLASNYSGLVFSAGGSSPRWIKFASSRITNPGALVTFKEAVVTELLLMDSTVTEARHLFNSLTPINPTSFNSSAAPLELIITTSTVTGPSTGFGQVYDPNACVDISVSVASVSGFEINCNSPDSTNEKDRCDYQFSQTQVIDNHLCIFGTPSSSFDISQTNFVVTTPLKAPVMTWIRDVSLYLAGSTSFTTTGSASAANDTSIAYLFSGINKIPDYPFISFRDITMDTGARLDLFMGNFSGVIKMRNASVIRLPDTNSRLSIFGHTQFVMDGEGTATIETNSLRTLYLSADANSAKTGSPIADVGPGVSFIIAATYRFSDRIIVYWDYRLERPANRSYPLINNLIYTNGIPPIGDRFEIPGYSFYSHDFTGWFEPTQCSNGLCYSLSFGLASVFPKKHASASCQGVDYGPRFSCINGEYFCVGRLQINHTMEIWHYSSEVYVHGDITFGPGGSLRLVGNSPGIRLSGCFYAPEETVVTLDYSYGWPKKMDKWTQNAIIQSPNCKSNRTSIPYNIVTPRSCKSWIATPHASTTNGLAVDWTLDNRRCVLWLALGLGLGGGVLLLIIGIIVFVAVRRHRATDSDRDRLLGVTTLLMDESGSEYEPLN